ncbi:carotenoid ester lipase precursor [Flammula alnicola]|nr:carotenoid ester lipase precursor [Flammula alnicola]
MAELGTATAAANNGPIVTLNYGSFQGNATGKVVEFLGMPFAAPPVRNLRFANPQAPIPFEGVRQATQFGAECFQMDLTGNASAAIVGSEDCLFINVVKPANIPAGKKLPVLFWIFGGGFEVGSSTGNPGDTVVERSITLDEPVVFVSPNYRVNAMGFIGGQQIKNAGLGNNGLRDQRFAMQWVQQHIEAFGGDPTKESGSPQAIPDITLQQRFFDELVTNTGCTGSANPIQCLRAVPFAQLGAAINGSPGFLTETSIQLAYQPSIDGEFLIRDPQISIQQGLYARVPLVTGDCDDEGTVFALSSLNVTFFKGNLPQAELNAIAEAYPSDPTQGSPFGTGTANAVTPEFKRIAAFLGDLGFQSPRRFFLHAASKTQPTFAFLFQRGKDTPTTGSNHGSDVPEFFGTGTNPDFIGTDALVNFANTLNPTKPSSPNSLLSGITWNEYSSSVTNPPLLTFVDPAPAIEITFDTFRLQPMQLLGNISVEFAGKDII